MPLILRIQSRAGLPLPTPLSHCFDEAGGTIGRQEQGNGLVLEDPSKFISRVHARIDFAEDAYRIADTGTNPSLLNDRPLAPHSPAKLANGDRLAIGEYAIAVEVGVNTTATIPEAVTPPAQSTPQSTLLQPRPAPAAFSADAVTPRADDSLANASILNDTEGFDPADPLGVDLFNTPLAVPAVAAASDPVAPEIAAFPIPVASPQLAIPDDYDALADSRAKQPIPAAAPTSTPVSEPAQSSPGDDIMQALLRGLDMPALRGTRADAETAELAGRLLREAIAGTMDVLKARTLTKRESRIDGTMIAPQANNPLKFFPDAAAALSQMLGNTMQGYLPPVPAMAQAFDDLRAHELAVMAGMRAALASVLHRFDPVGIEQHAEATETGLVTRLLAARNAETLCKACNWDRLVALHAELSRDAEHDFQRLYGERFADAYEEQVERARS